MPFGNSASPPKRRYPTAFDALSGIALLPLSVFPDIRFFPVHPPFHPFFPASSERPFGKTCPFIFPNLPFCPTKAPLSPCQTSPFEKQGLRHRVKTFPASTAKTCSSGVTFIYSKSVIRIQPDFKKDSPRTFSDHIVPFIGKTHALFTDLLSDGGRMLKTTRISIINRFIYCHIKMFFYICIIR